MKNFTVEEINLMCCFNTSSRKRLIDDMKSVTLNDMDGEIAELMYHADYILAVWNGCPSGTGNTVRYAHKKGKTIIVINPVSLDVTRE